MTMLNVLVVNLCGFLHIYELLDKYCEHDSYTVCQIDATIIILFAMLLIKKVIFLHFFQILRLF